jgi:dynein heavy chain
VGGGGTGGGLAGRDATVGALADDILRRLPPPFDVEKAAARYPVRYEESLNQVLCQEMLRFNRLTAVIRASLGALRKAVAGLQVMAAETEGVLRAMSLGAVPDHWRAKSYPSLRPLASYVDDLLRRLAVLEVKRPPRKSMRLRSLGGWS